MSLNVAKLEKVCELPGGLFQARCPACAEGGHDRAGKHLRIYPDGRFGCCVYPKDGEHRKRIFALAGDRKPGTFTVRVTLATPRLTTRSVKAALSTPVPRQTGQESEASSSSRLARPYSGTLGTPIFKSRAYEKEENHVEHLTDLENGVPSVPSDKLPAAGERLPSLTAGGDLVIPFDSPALYHWWKTGQSVAATMTEVTANG